MVYERMTIDGATIDGIYYNRLDVTHHCRWMFELIDDHEDICGICVSSWTDARVPWSLGEINEEIWLKYGAITTQSLKEYEGSWSMIG